MVVAMGYSSMAAACPRDAPKFEDGEMMDCMGRERLCAINSAPSAAPFAALVKPAEIYRHRV